MALPTTRERILDAATTAFGGRGYRATSLDDLARDLGVAKQTILYWFASKEALLEAVLDAAGGELAGALERTLARQADVGGWPRIEAVVRTAFRVGARRPALFGVLREADRLGPPASVRPLERLAPLAERATAWLRSEMDAGRLRHHDPDVVLLTGYSLVLALVTDLETQTALGAGVSVRAVVHRRRALERLLRAALEPERRIVDSGERR